MPAYTWTTGETITAAKLQALEDEAWRVANLLASNTSTTETSTSSSTFVNAAASVTFTAKSSSVYAQISGGGTYAIGGGAVCRLGINLNGTDYTVSHGIGPATGNVYPPFCGGIVVTGLTPGTSYTATLRVRTSSSGGVNRDGYSRQTITVWDISK